MSPPLVLVICLAGALSLSLVLTALAVRRAARLRLQLDASGARFQELLETDELTGLLNRRGAVHAGDRLLASRRSWLHVAIVDVDHLRSVNDAHGYEVGDQLLWTLAGRMGSLLRGSDNALARLGGGRFVALLAAESPAHALATAERLRHVVGRGTTATTAGRLSVTVSIGLSAAQPGDRLDDVLDRAAAGLEAARAAGRDRVVVQAPVAELPVPRRAVLPAVAPLSPH